MDVPRPPYLHDKELEQAVRVISLVATGRNPFSDEPFETLRLDSEQDRVKRSALGAWVNGVNAKGGFGVWCSDVVFEPAQIQDCLARNSRS